MASMLGERVSKRQCAELARVTRTAAGSHWLELNAEAVASSYNRRPFLVKHHLGSHPLVAVPALFDLCRRLPAEQVQFRYGAVPANAHFDSSLERFRKDLTLSTAIEQFEARQAYIVIYNAERDPEYRKLMEGLLGELAVGIEPFDRCINWYSTYIFVTAQNSVTPYHMDREMNFLLQIRGTKVVRLWDPYDDEVMTPAQKDRLFAIAGKDVRPVFTPELERKALIFDLEPGLGVHHPFIAPHLVRTGPELSVSLALTFRTPKSDVWSGAHRFNARLRQRGWSPSPVGRSSVVDFTKAALQRFAGAQTV